VPITESGGLGDALTPEQWASYVLDHLAAASVVLASGATEIRTSNQTVHLPRVTGDGGAGWYGELDPIGPGDPTGDELVLTPKKCAAITTLSNEAVNDSDPSALDAVGAAMVRAVALACDAAYFNGTGPANDQPTGVLSLGLPAHIGAVDYAGVVTAAGLVRATGGQPDVLFVNPADLTSLQLATDANDRPLISGDPTAGAPPVIAGLAVWATPAVPAAQALIAQADQIVVAIRSDASVAISGDAIFVQDGTVARVIACTDVGVNDLDGLCVIKAAAGRSAKAAEAPERLAEGGRSGTPGLLPPGHRKSRLGQRCGMTPDEVNPDRPEQR
jgi:HK97 family phage major capsid protein